MCSVMTVWQSVYCVYCQVQFCCTKMSGAEVASIRLDSRRETLARLRQQLAATCDIPDWRLQMVLIDGTALLWALPLLSLLLRSLTCCRCRYELLRATLLSHLLLLYAYTLLLRIPSKRIATAQSLRQSGGYL